MDRKMSTSDGKEKDKHGWEEENLDEEMEDIFHPSRDHFSLTDLGVEIAQVEPHIDEKDFDMHRRESFQYHQPLHRLHHHKHKKGEKKSEKKETEAKSQPSAMRTVDEEPTTEPPQEEPLESEPLLAGVKTTEPKNEPSEEKVQFYVGSSSSLEKTTTPAKKPLKSVLRVFTGKKDQKKSPSFALPSGSSKKPSQGALSLPESELYKEDSHKSSSSQLPDASEKNKVKFMLGEESQNDIPSELQSDHQSSETVTPHKHTRRRTAKRRHHGFSIDSETYNTVEPEEAETLNKSDIDDIKCHRYDDPKGYQMSKIKNKFWPSFKKKDDSLFPFMKKKYDHEPHELFIELHELQQSDLSDLEWRETARWIKYEENAELGPDRWGKPHVPPLCFHSLVKLRQCIESGAVLLDLEESDPTTIVRKIVDALVQTDQINSDQYDLIFRTLLRSHRHVNEKSQPSLRRNSAGYGNLNLLGHEKTRSPLFSKSRSKSVSDTNHVLNNGENSTVPETSILMTNLNNAEITPSSKRKSIVGLSSDRLHEPIIMRRVPENSEGVIVLVGELPELEKPASAFVRLAEGTKEVSDVLEVRLKMRFIFVCLGPDSSIINYHEVGRALGSLMSNNEFRERVYKASTRKDILSAINRFLDSSTVVPPGKWERPSLLPLEEIRRKSLMSVKTSKDKFEKPSYDPLQRRKKCFGGLVQDIKHRYPFYASDISDGFNFQCIASVIFIYFAAVSGAIAFGGLFADKTGMAIGVSETLVGTCICGVLFALLAGQPLIIIGTTGPLLLFDEILFSLKEYYSLPFLVMRVWVGLATAIIALIVVAAEGSVLVKHFSRFVQEIFATIISLLFIVESVTKLYRIFHENPLLKDYCGLSNSTTTSPGEIPTTPQPNTALLSMILMIGTFYIALFLRHFRNSKFLGRSARRALGDFGVPIGIVIMVLVDYLIPETYTEKLTVPEGLTPSTDRSWIISPGPITAWEVAIAFLCGFLLFILIFMETQICELIMSKKKLKKGSGFHLDMVLIGFMEVISGFIGGPWMCAATVRSITHCSSLIVWSKTHAPGELPHIVDVREQRLTNMLVSLLVGISVLMAPLLRLIPMAVLFGVFLYMGISALSGIHLYERFLLIFMPIKHHPDFPFVRKVRTSRMHLYTILQIVLIALLWIIKTYIAVAFPFGLLTMILIQKITQKLFTEEESRALEGEEEAEEEKEDEPDFYEQIVA